MNFDFKSTLKIVSLSFILLFIIGYALFEFRWVIQGPKISVETAKNGESFDTSFGIIDNKKIGIHCLAEDKPVIIIIKNEFIAKTLKNYFEVLWKMSILS